MSSDTRTAAGPKVTYTAARFALGGIPGYLTLVATGPRGGVLALTVPWLMFFAGACWAAGALRLGVRGRVAFGLAAMFTTLGSMLAIVRTQALSGRESLVVVLPVLFLELNTVGSVIGLLVILPGKAKAFAYAVLGFAAGSLVAGALVAGMIGAADGPRVAWPLVAVPEIAGGTAAAWALTSRRPSRSELNRRS